MNEADRVQTGGEALDRVLADQVQDAATGVPTTVAANLAASVLLVFVMSGQVSRWALYGWFAAQAAYQVLRVIVARAYWRHWPATNDGVRRWANRFTVMAILSGCAWGVTALLFFLPQSTMHLALLAVLLCGMAAGSSPANALLMTGLLGSSVAILGIFIVRLAWQDGSGYWPMAAMLVVYLGFVLHWGRSLHRVLVESLKRRHHNESLIDQLQRQTEAALSAQRRAEEANLAKSKFLAAASHDLRQPMHALVLFSGALIDEQRPAEAHALAHHIARSVDALEMLFNSLLDISKLDAGVTKPVVTDFYLDSLFSRLEDDFGGLAAGKRLALRIRPTGAVMRTDAQMLEQILRNLLSNALHYTERGGILVGCRRRGNAWRIDVVDTGIGIAAAEQERVFEEFYQVGNPERDRRKGLGLGLAIVRRLSKLLDVPVVLRSRFGRGSVFSVTVPAGTAVPQVRSEVAELGAYFDALRVLVVDDEPDVRLGLGLLLRGWGCDVLEAESHVQAVAAMEAAQWQPEFAIVDFRLAEGKTGLEVLDWLHEHFGADLPGIVISGDIAAERLHEVQASGYPLLHKPVSPAKLRSVLRNMGGDKCVSSKPPVRSDAPPAG